MKKLFTEEMINKIKEANESVSGTSVYNKYYLCMESKNENGRWSYVGWTIPHITGYFKTIKEKNLYHLHRLFGEYLSLYC